MSEAALVIVDVTEGVAELRLNRPSALNAFDIPLADAFAKAVANIVADDRVRAILITAEGKGFVAGGDVSAMGASPERGHEVVNQLLGILNPAVLALRRSDAPVIAAVRSVAAGAGLSLLASADLVVLDQNAKLVMGYDQVGGIPDCGGSWFLTHRLGRGRVMELMLLGRAISATEALNSGLATEICPEAEVEATARAMAQKIAQGPTVSFGKFRRLVDQACVSGLAEQLETERSAFVSVAQTEDFQEGVSAFLARRKPHFQGK